MKTNLVNCLAFPTLCTNCHETVPGHTDHHCGDGEPYNVALPGAKQRRKKALYETAKTLDRQILDFDHNGLDTIKLRQAVTLIKGFLNEELKDLG